MNIDISTIFSAIISLAMIYVGIISTIVLKKQSGLIKDTSEVHNLFKSNFEISKDLFNPEIIKNVVTIHKEELELSHKKELNEIRNSKMESDEKLKEYDLKYQRLQREYQLKSFDYNILITLVSSYDLQFPEKNNMKEFLHLLQKDDILKEIEEAQKSIIQRSEELQMIKISNNK